MHSLALSIVSHLQGQEVGYLLNDLADVCERRDIRVLLTINLPEELPFDPRAFPFDVTVIRNNSPKGFGANHNAAFGESDAPVFCVMNPDVRLTGDPFPDLLSALDGSEVGVCAPLIVNSHGEIADSARRMITPLGIGMRTLGLDNQAIYPVGGSFAYPDWVAGIMMVFSSRVFSDVHGFDERYFMYCEDADICTRLWERHYKVVLVPRMKIIHDARRSSHRSLKFFLWHTSSLVRFFFTYPRPVR